MRESLRLDKTTVKYLNGIRNNRENVESKAAVK